MSIVKTNNPAEQDRVNTVNYLHELFFRYRMKRYRHEPNPDFSKACWYLGMKEKAALWSCEHCIDVKRGPNDSSHQGARFLDLPVYWVQEDSHVALGEMK